MDFLDLDQMMQSGGQSVDLLRRREMGWRDR